jgi:uncharacterized membrane protein YedE/YeeE
MTVTMPMTPEELDRLAHRRASRKIGWYMHACIYIIVNTYWLIGPYLGLHPRTYSLAPTLGWGLGLALHFISVFVLGKGSSFRDQMVQRERERIQREQNRP